MLGKFEYEHEGNMFTLHIGLTPPMYCCEIDDKNATKKGKGIDRQIVRNTLTVGDFLYTLTGNNKPHYTYNKVCSKNHQVFSITINKVGLSSYDNNIFYTDNITSLPYGHHSIN